MAGSAEPAASCHHGYASWVIVANDGSSFLTSSHCAGTGCWVSGTVAWVGCCTSCLGDSTSCARSPGSSQTVAGIFVQLFGSLSPHPHRDSPWEALLQRRQRWRREGKNERVRDTHNPCDPEYLPPGPLAHESCSSRSAVGRLQTDLGSKSRS